MAKISKATKSNYPLEWNLKLLFPGGNIKLEDEYTKVTDAFEKFAAKWEKRSDYLKDATALKKALDEYEKLQENFGNGGNAGMYVWLKYHQDQLKSQNKADYSKLEKLLQDLANKIQFFDLRISRIDPKLQAKFLKDQDLQKYKHFLERLFESAKYLLSEPEEKIMNLKSQTAYSNWVKMVEGFLSKEERVALNDEGKKENLTFDTLLGLSYNGKTKKIRDEAAKAFNDILEKNSDIAAEELNSVLADKEVNDNLRGFKRPDSSRHLADDMDTEVVDTLLETVAKRNDLARRFYKFKAKLFKLPKFSYHERNMEYGDLDLTFSYDQAVELVRKVMARLDPEFEKLYLQFVTNGQFDVYPKKGKAGGAFCIAWQLPQPSFILLNFTSKLTDILTIAHEMGHGINNELIRQKQPAIYFDTPTSTAEIVSVFMEDFVLDEIGQKVSDKQKLELLVHRLNREVATLFRQIAAYRFEQEIHQLYREKRYLSKEEIGKTFQKFMSEYMGEAVEQSPGSENWWVYWSHLRRYFYNYAYANGDVMAKALQSMVRENPDNIERVKFFLSAGTSDSPKNIFSQIGIDVTDQKFWEKGVSEFENMLKEAEKLAKKLGKI